MPDHIPSPHKPFTFSGLVLSSLMTGSLICGVIGGLAVLFLGDGLFDAGPDPAIPVAEMKQRLAQADQRIQHLEKAAQQQASAPQRAATPSELAALQQKVDTLSANKQSENKAAQIALGLTQIKTAYENDLPLGTGIDTLKSAVTSTSLQKTLDDLAATTSDNFPTKKELLSDIDQMKASLTATPADPKALTWDQRAKYELNKFVTVQPQQVTAQKSLLSQVEQSIRNNDFTTALATLQKMPADTQQAVFYKKIEMRARAEGMIQNVISDVTQKIGLGSQGALY